MHKLRECITRRECALGTEPLGGVSSDGQWTFKASLIVWSFCWTYFDWGCIPKEILSQSVPGYLVWTASSYAMKLQCCSVRLVRWSEGGLEGMLFTMVQNRDISKYKWLLLWLVFSDFLLSAFLIPLLFSSFIWYIWEPQETNFLRLGSFWIFGPCVNKHIYVCTIPVSLTSSSDSPHEEEWSVSLVIWGSQVRGVVNNSISTQR